MVDPKSLIIKLAHIYYHTGSWDKAILEYEKIIAMDPNDYNVHLTLGELYQKKGDLERAYKEYEISAGGFLREKNVKKASAAFRELASLVQKMVEPQDLDQAIEIYKNMLSKIPDSQEVLINLRDLYLRHNQMDEALQRTLQLGDLFNQLDYVDKAMAEYTKACSIDPANESAKLKLEKLQNDLKSPIPKQTGF
jgi:tetratricopeptide (TPR) repeat protein